KHRSQEQKTEPAQTNRQHLTGDQRQNKADNADNARHYPARMEQLDADTEHRSQAQKDSYIRIGQDRDDLLLEGHLDRHPWCARERLESYRNTADIDRPAFKLGEQLLSIG